MALKTCLICGAITANSRCDAHRLSSSHTKRDSLRPSREARGYGNDWRALVKRVVVRDQGVCWLCGKPGATTGDHVVPLSKGGARLDPSNVRAAHHACNSGKRDRVIPT